MAHMNASCTWLWRSWGNMRPNWVAVRKFAVSTMASPTKVSPGLQQGELRNRAETGGFPQLWIPFWGPCNKDLVNCVGALLFRETTNRL